ncbi:hypothetical protein [Paracoccus sp. SM22M-07]|uniref:hypothetical protein n=1 Tax=Paracoccus sp. SM22M-07 TaxID=1520813 RepID=UPI0009219142|nr:hypothetical protein [Paracoccus sp. SM22M-07]OJH44738.1 hypothetical protein IE00_07955 [Paracoccus sp. SM22M-07]
MMQFESHGLKGGLWRGRLTHPQGAPARITLILNGAVMAEGRMTADGEGASLVEVDLPREVLSEGMQTLLLRADAGEAGAEAHPDAELLARLPLLAGRPLDDDMTAEITALRAELELVKRELRRFAANSRGG